MKSHKLLKLTSSLYNTPHLITTQAFDEVLNYLDSRNKGIPTLLLPAMDDAEDEESVPDDLDDFEECPLPVTVIYISGSLTYAPVETMCGTVGTSYKGLLEDVEDAIEKGTETIIFNIASGGGEASHIFEYAEEIRAMCDEANVKLIGYADTQACSAAYALGAICDELYANPSATLGSIGCVVCLLDTSKAMDMEGYKRIFITSGSNKVPFDDDGSFKDSFLEEIQVSVDKLNNQFTSHVAKYTTLSEDSIRGLEAACFDADESLAKGLISGIMTNREFVKYIVSKQGVTNA